MDPDSRLTAEQALEHPFIKNNHELDETVLPDEVVTNIKKF